MLKYRKQITALILMLIMALCLSACASTTESPSASEAPGTTQTPGATKAPDSSETPGATSTPDQTPTPTPTPTQTQTPAPTNNFSITIKENEYISHTLTLTDNGDSTGVLEIISEVLNLSSEADINHITAQYGIEGEGPVILNEVMLFSVNFIEDSGKIKANGTVCSVSQNISGGSIVQAIIEKAKQTYENSPETLFPEDKNLIENIVYGKRLESEDELHDYFGDILPDIEIVFTVEDGICNLESISGIEHGKMYSIMSVVLLNNNLALKTERYIKFSEEDYTLTAYTEYIYRENNTLEKYKYYCEIDIDIALLQIAYFDEHGKDLIRNEIYNANGTISEITTYDGKNSHSEYYTDEGVLESVEDSTYDENGNLTIFVKYYDENGNLSGADETYWEGDAEISKYYDEDNILTCILTVYNDEEDRRTFVYYDDEGNIINISHYINYYTAVKDEHYNEDGSLNYIVYYQDQSPWYTEYYDENGNIEKTVYHD